MVPRIAGTVVDLWLIQCLHRGCSSVVHYNELTKTNEYTGYDNDRLRHIRLHEQVNELPDPNYATLKFFMGHLDRYVMMTLRPPMDQNQTNGAFRIRRKESINQMSVSNLSIVFGPTLLGAPPEEGGLNLEHMSFQCKVCWRS